MPDNAKLIIGDIKETVSKQSPIAFIAVDVDYYSSTKECLNVLLGEPEKYLPMTLVYLDDIGAPSSNPWVGELLAVNEFNAENAHRKIHPFTFLRMQRIFKQTRWIEQILILHTLDHEWRSAKTELTQAIYY